MQKPIGGRPALYAPKDGKAQVRAITTEGATILERIRTHVTKLSGWSGKLSDSDLADYLVRVWRGGREKADREITK